MILIIDYCGSTRVDPPQHWDWLNLFSHDAVVWEEGEEAGHCERVNQRMKQ